MKIFALLLSVLMAFSLVACGSSEPTATSDNNNEKDNQESLINIVGAYYGPCGAEDGYEDLYIVFDYANDSVNRTMPEESSAVTATVNGTNLYEANANSETEMYHDGETYITTPYSWFERYTGYKYILGYGNLLGGSEPVRMFAHFTFNPNDLNTGEELILTVDEQIAEFAVSDVQKISVMDEILMCNGNFETEQMVAATKWRLDTAYRIIWFLTGVNASFGDDFSAMGSAMRTLFSEDSKGLTVCEEPVYGCKKNSDTNTYTYNEVIESLPSYNYDVIAENCPEIADQLIIVETNMYALADALENPNSSYDEVESLMKTILDAYFTIYDTWGMEYAPK